jgi:hypothetical protein
MPGEEPSSKDIDQNAERISIWGLITKGGRRVLRITTGSMTKEKYHKLLDDVSKEVRKWPRWKEFKWMQDNARPHCGGLDKMKAKGFQVVPDWCPRSCDLNPIEQCWAILKARISEEAPWSVEDLITFTKKAWSEISNATIDNLCCHWKERLRKCIAAEGKVIKPSRTPKQ